MTDPHATHSPKSTVQEPETPMWLPALGVALFLSAGIWWASTSKSEAIAPDAEAAAASAVPVVASATHTTASAPAGAIGHAPPPQMPALAPTNLPRLAPGARINPSNNPSNARAAGAAPAASH